ncbi:MAG: enoyl-CoA hydratase/isomerase family protein [Halobacteriovoraceae bacterium]|nr:enoyl-CoA hydratase/isomerase family protein [Halobacteriovoraceae bacterium]
MSKKLVLKEVRDSVCWLTLNRPNQSNALNSQLIHEFIEELNICERDASIRCVVVTGAGKNFCAGGDIDKMLTKEDIFAGESNELRNLYAQNIQKIPQTIESMQTPIIAYINGAAVGAGLDLACMCDIRVGTVNSRMGETFANLSLVPGDGGTFFLSRIVGFAKAMEMFLTCDILSYEESLKVGLLNHVYDIDTARKDCQKLALKIASKAPVGIALTKQALKQAQNSNLYDHLQLLAAFQGIAQRTQDHFEGLRAFREKRDPKFFGI